MPSVASAPDCCVDPLVDPAFTSTFDNELVLPCGVDMSASALALQESLTASVLVCLLLQSTHSCLSAMSMSPLWLQCWYVPHLVNPMFSGLMRIHLGTGLSLIRLRTHGWKSESVTVYTHNQSNIQQSLRKISIWDFHDCDVHNS